MPHPNLSILYGLQCPKCGAEEMHPTDKDKCLIRAYKVDVGQGWESQCLVCAGYYDKDLKYDDEAGDAEKGWFL